MSKQAMIRADGLVRDASVVENAFQASRMITQSLATGTGTLTTGQCMPGGLLIRSGQAAAVADTLPTAAQLTAAFPDVDNGEAVSFTMENRNTGTGVITLTASTGVTLAAGARATLAIATAARVVLTRTSATAWTFAAQ